MTQVLSQCSAWQHRRKNQRGSALLIVLVFAAVVAILLFMQMPVLIFEAQRNKEQLLIDRGNEYKQGIRLYVRKFGHYPPSFDALENTNRVRFLRKRFKDPFTDKDDWRLIHAGPNGMPIDSKLNILQTTTNGQTTSNAGNSPFGSSSNGGSQPGNQSTFGGSGGFGNGGFGSSGNNLSGGFGSSSSNTGGASGFGGSSSFGGFNNSTRAAQPGSSPSPGSGLPPGMENGIASNPEGIDPNVVPGASSQAHSANGQASGVGDNGSILPAVTPSGVPQPVISRSAVPVGTNGSATGAAAPLQLMQGAGISQGNVDPNNPNAGLNTLLSNPNPQTPQTAGAAGFNVSTGAGGSSTFGATSSSSNSPFGSSSNTSSSGFGVIQNGGLAGVASKAERHSIKAVNDQRQYDLWEFYYDPNKDPLRNGAAALAQIGASMTGATAQFGNTGIGGAPGAAANNGSSNSPFSSGNNGSSPFSSGSSGSNPFSSGSSGSNPFSSGSSGSNPFSSGSSGSNPFSSGSNGLSGFGNSGSSSMQIPAATPPPPTAQVPPSQQ